MPLGAADGQIHLRGAPAQAHAAGLGVLFKKFLVGQAADGDDLVCHGIQCEPLPKDYHAGQGCQPENAHF
jgi:hypothetical protein